MTSRASFQISMVGYAPKTSAASAMAVSLAPGGNMILCGQQIEAIERHGPRFS
jgi:hypothetical protein